MVWEASQKGVPFLGVPGNSLKIITCLVGDPYKPSFPTITERGAHTQVIPYRSIAVSTSQFCQLKSWNLTASWTNAELPAIEIYRTQKLGFFQCSRISRHGLKNLNLESFQWFIPFEQTVAKTACLVIILTILLKYWNKRSKHEKMSENNMPLCQ